jgi:hypothetical protein
VRRGFGLVEIMVGVFIVAALGVPVLSNVSTAVRQTAAGEEYMFAEALAQEHLEQALAMPVRELARDLPHWTQVPAHGDKDQERTEKLESLRAHLTGSESYRGSVTVEELEPFLWKYTVTVEWPVAPGASEMRRLVLVRMRCLPDAGLKYREKGDARPHEAALEAVRE